MMVSPVSSPVSRRGQSAVIVFGASRPSVRPSVLQGACLRDGQPCVQPCQQARPECGHRVRCLTSVRPSVLQGACLRDGQPCVQPCQQARPECGHRVRCLTSVRPSVLQGACLRDGQPCVQPCQQARPECGHPCGQPCHGDEPCPPSSCKTLVRHPSSSVLILRATKNVFKG